jgi:hypothetical protein
MHALGITGYSYMLIYDDTVPDALIVRTNHKKDTLAKIIFKVSLDGLFQPQQHTISRIEG